ncbi:preproproctase B [Aspergillus ellipticus CBS 707.79]|uniref:Aspergillopepsin-1 n=1 Tax=Aspergillus ellipticus CBS 707.79 TaxID=1448320 RepID=A0A319DK38_9EURO|nr:preproproctase B [Aspergillus ellipticus CBS 707.79]
MSPVSKIAVAAALTVGAVAAPAAQQFPSSFTVNQVARPVANKTINLAANYARTLTKFKATVPEHVAAAAVSGTVVATPSDADDDEYDCPVTVGSSTLKLDFDTGSSDLWVFSDKLSSTESAGHSVYTPSSSATELSGYSWDIYYGDGSSASGIVYDDKVTVGGATYSKQAVEAATEVSSEFVSDTSNDGLLGLGFSSINTVEPVAQKTFFDNIKSSLASPIFTAYLKHDAAGSYDFGFIDSSKYTGEIAYVDADSSEGYWGFTASGYGVGDSVTVDESWSAIADTGTTLMYLPTRLVEAYYDQVSGSSNSDYYGGWIYPCDATLPDFSVQIGSHVATVPAEYLTYATVSSTDTSECFGGIQDDSDLGLSIFGDTFLKSQFVVFDASGPQLGFATQA